MFPFLNCCIITSIAGLAFTVQARRDVRSQVMIEDYALSLGMPAWLSTCLFLLLYISLARLPTQMRN